MVNLPSEVSVKYPYLLELNFTLTENSAGKLAEKLFRIFQVLVQGILVLSLVVLQHMS